MFETIIYRLKRPYHFFRTGLLEGLPAQVISRGATKKMSIIAITGTDGKTTTSTLLYSILNAAHIKTGLISTVGASIGDKTLETGLHVTSPSPRQLFSILRQMNKKKCTHVVLEATSHGIYQYRFWGIKPTIAGVTNITHEHLDYHLSWNNYAQAKLLLLKKAKHIYLNSEDNSYNYLHRQKWSKKQEITSYNLRTLLPKNISSAIQKRFVEPYNRSNAILASLIALELGASAPDIVKAITAFAGVPGRMQVVSTTPITTIVDFAHTPNALENVLTAVRRTLKPGTHLIAVYGCAGLRDVQKRPLMGAIGARLADTAIFTAEDPRTENVWSIFRQMKDGITTDHNRVITIADRGEAIAYAIHSVARAGDTGIVCGKGHEQSMCFGTEEVPWSDLTAIQQQLSVKPKKK